MKFSEQKRTQEDVQNRRGLNCWGTCGAEADGWPKILPPVLLCSSASNHLPTYPSDFPGHTHESGCKIVKIAERVLEKRKKEAQSRGVFFASVVIQHKTKQCYVFWRTILWFVWFLLDLGFFDVLWDLGFLDIFGDYLGLLWMLLYAFEFVKILWDSMDLYEILWDFMALLYGILWEGYWSFLNKFVSSWTLNNQMNAHDSFIVCHLWSAWK